MESGLNQSPVRLNYGNSVLGLPRDGGFTTPMTYRAFLLIDSYLYGFVMQEVHWPFEEADIPQVAEAMTTQLSPEDSPHLLEVSRHVMTANAEGNFRGVYDAEFSAGLELILDSLARLRDAHGPQSVAGLPAPAVDAHRKLTISAR